VSALTLQLRGPLRPPRRAVFAGLVLAVATAHWAALEAAGPAGPQARPAGTVAMQVRQLPMPAPPPAPVRSALPRADGAAPRPHAPAPAAPAAPAEPPATAPAPAPEAAAAPAGMAAPPVYATRPPPAFQRLYALERGARQGEALLEWQPGEDRYSLRMSAQLDGRAVLGSASRGGFDHAGLAPERFVETRRDRPVRATNFEREAGHIAFSGPTLKAPLHDGAQDALSWIVQLAAVLEADPSLDEVRLAVTGTRGDSAVWRFVRVAGADDGEGPALAHFRRDAEHERDTRVELWLDPADHHLPQRFTLGFHGRGETTTFRRLPR
jgi:hypothetical protein